MYSYKLISKQGNANGDKVWKYKIYGFKNDKSNLFGYCKSHIKEFKNAVPHDKWMKKTNNGRVMEYVKRHHYHYTLSKGSMVKDKCVYILIIYYSIAHTPSVNVRVRRKKREQNKIEPLKDHYEIIHGETVDETIKRKAKEEIKEQREKEKKRARIDRELNRLGKKAKKQREKEEKQQERLEAKKQREIKKWKIEDEKRKAKWEKEKRRKEKQKEQNAIKRSKKKARTDKKLDDREQYDFNIM